ncbi:putative colanic acid biosynthesis acetyltransferase [Rhizobium sp. XQZ8]|uniref:putative colanic acid biosynthesis acetyltransferase n=1 Tax=Rhizobium populisoli TaxID=2859785 RepID=UPI001CA5BE31|nr:putative colanic acid biosynthesis acetyltransferase [Rhizobium populisoli]MBW6420397.1 putative colanic acid biosynthesis acetyltransferase [Rhizobium populisoli]
MTPLDHKQSKPRDGGPSFSKRHRLIRFAWNLAWTMLAVWTPVPLYGWRRFLLNAFGADIHRTAKIYPNVRVWYPRNLKMAEYSCLAPEVNCYCMDRIEIAAYALVSQGAYLCGGTHDIDDPNFQLIVKPITIKANAWVAAEAFVGPGVTIGEGAVLGARAVAFKNLEPFTVYAGSPAKPIRKRMINGAAA